MPHRSSPLPRLLLLRVWNGKGCAGGGVSVAVFCTPCAVRFCEQSIVGWTSALCPTACAVTRRAPAPSPPPRDWSVAAASTHPHWVRGEGTPCGGRCKPQWGFREKKQAHTHTHAHCAVTVRQTGCSCFRNWARSSSIQHELIITSVWSCLERARYTPSA